ncbi:endonuclease domain-containing protein [Patescibacteria group bacterium]|nr:endonuclease domain-containing protein [Patescibacteria group bacterium]
MDQYKSFIFDAFDFNQKEGCIELKYSLDDSVRFLETIELPSGMEYQSVPLAIIDRALFALHLIGGTSYFKTFCPPQIQIQSGELNANHAAFWNRVYSKGLGEFCFQNKIDPATLASFPSSEATPLLSIERPKNAGSVLVPIGGGKDSIVTIELLKKAGKNVTLLRMNEHPLITELIDSTGLPSINVERTLSQHLFDVNKQGAMNGHIPITAYVSCLSVVIALLYGFETIVMSNESSASEGNTEKGGQKVNHQWSKSWEFEKLFSKYIHSSITTDLKYFSLLRHISELAITKYFSTLPEYFTKVTSCNRNWKIMKDNITERWCCECPKCAFSFCMYAAFLPHKTLIEIFGKNLYEDTTLRILYRELLGLEGMKPFDCVGTVEEVQAAFILAHNRRDLDSNPIMQMFLEEVLPTIKDPDKVVATALEPSYEHAIPEEFLSALHAPD